MHRINAADRAISIWKNHFVLGIIGNYKLFPMHLWDRLLDQSQITLNILRPSRCNPKISAHAVMEGKFEFNKTPLVPIGTKVVGHEKPNRRHT